jgi:hypothetical protein
MTAMGELRARKLRRRRWHGPVAFAYAPEAEANVVHGAGARRAASRNPRAPGSPQRRYRRVLRGGPLLASLRGVRSLVVYYPRTGTVRNVVAGVIARAMGADLEESVDTAPCDGVLGFHQQ